MCGDWLDAWQFKVHSSSLWLLFFYWLIFDENLLTCIYNLFTKMKGQYGSAIYGSLFSLELRLWY